MSVDEKGEYKEIFEKALEISRLIDRGCDLHLRVEIDRQGVRIMRFEHYQPNEDDYDLKLTAKELENFKKALAFIFDKHECVDN